MDAPRQINLDKSSNDELSVNAVRTLTIDAVQKANSGHPGTPMGMAPVAIRCGRISSLDPSDPLWPNRDRFVLSAGRSIASVVHVAAFVGREAPVQRRGHRQARGQP